MVAGVNYCLRAVVQLPWFTGFYTDAGIGVGGAVVCVVAQKLRANEVTVFIYLFAVGIAGLIFILFSFPRMVLFNFFLPPIAYGVFF
jgi:hypothetical protein